MKKKMNYRTTVHITGQWMKLGFRCSLPQGTDGSDIRVQAVFRKRSSERLMAMDVRIEDSDIGKQVIADADILLPYVFTVPPRHTVSVNFVFWQGAESVVLSDQPFPVQKELFARQDLVQARKPARFALLTLGLPALLARYHFQKGLTGREATKKAHDYVYSRSGYGYSPRQRNTDYFADYYRRLVSGKHKPETGRILFLSERPLDPEGNLGLVMERLGREEDLELETFIHMETVDRLSRKQLRECAEKCARAKVIVLEDFYPQIHALRKSPDTQLVQLWHACGAFKTFGLTRAGKPDCVPQTSMNHRNYDLASVSGEKIRGIYAEAFGIPASKVKALGVPRTDLFFDRERMDRIREELYGRYPEAEGKKVIIYAPTFRGAGNKEAYFPEDAFSPEAFLQKMPEDCLLVLKHHPFVKKQISVGPDLADRLIIPEEGQSLNELMLFADLLITDYSSCVFEAALLSLPMIFYAFDQEEYTRERDFYFNYDHFVPGPVVHDFEEMTDLAAGMISNPGVAGRERIDRFREDYLDALDGHSTERIADQILAMVRGKSRV